LTEPYQGEDKYSGYGWHSDQEVQDFIKKAFEDKQQLLTHCNGDAAAYQYFEENDKGSIKEGKVADLVVLSANPLKIKKDKIKEIDVLETIKNGKSIYKIENGGE